MVHTIYQTQKEMIMKKNLSISTVLVPFIIILPLLYTAAIYPSLPETVPTHFDLSGTADAYGHKRSIWLISFLLASVSLLVYLLFSNLPKIDPKRTARQSPELFRKMALTISVFISAATNGTIIPGIGQLHVQR
jgi:uncharacterized membrane protein